MALRDIEPRETASVGIGTKSRRIGIRERIPYGYKFAVQDIGKGGHILKYGEIIGRTTQGITAGGHAHVQNIESLRGRGDLEKKGE